MDNYISYHEEVDEVKEARMIERCHVCDSLNVAGKVFEKAVCQECISLAQDLLDKV